MYLKREDLPEEATHLVFGEYGYDDAEAAYMRLRGTLEAFAAKTGLRLDISRESISNRWHPTRSGSVFLGDHAAGMIGEVADTIQSAFGVDRRVMVALVELDALFGEMRLTHRYVPLSEFPSITRDLSVIVDERVAFHDVAAAVKVGMVADVALADMYRGTGVPEGKKSMTLSVTIAAPDRTLTSEEAQAELDRAGKMLETTFGGILRS
ncbi:hypothetical protein HYS28_01945 [Candidatus Uhrbacteria bacterium]|nr:hypothetical protein [Candidatus Uhrbacteria bacterium]